MSYTDTWKDATLLNGASVGQYGYVKYRKNRDGIVQVKLSSVDLGTDKVFAQLPVGYRPPVDFIFKYRYANEWFLVDTSGTIEYSDSSQGTLGVFGMMFFDDSETEDTTGDTGPQGPKGDPGEDGTAFSPVDGGGAA